MDGGPIEGKRPQVESEADTFAAVFLMPEVQVRNIFSAIFGCEKFEIDSKSAFSLGFQNPSNFKQQMPTPRHLSVFLASVVMYAGVPKRSLTDMFGVSPMAMAIRLEELELV